LGCHGSDVLLYRKGETNSCNTCGFLLDDTVLLDAGTVGNKLALEAQARIRHVLLSHLHFDHIKGLPTLADNLSEQGGPPVIVAGLPEVVQGLRDHLFNNDVYPDFFKIPTPDNPVLTGSVLKLGTPYQAGKLVCTPIRVNHTVPTVGFLIDDSTSAILYSGDTFMTDEIWGIARAHGRLKAVFLECSYPDGLEHLAHISKHLTPRLFEKELAKLSRPDVKVFAYHLKPIYKEQISHELVQLNLPNLVILEEGQTIEV
jgi:glyoxylase-like metal-dependent hydrolase (beta-lactamase superfamily II)